MHHHPRSQQPSKHTRRHQTPLIVIALQLLVLLSLFTAGQWPLLVAADWDSWWTYEGISGPDFWGRLNPKWAHCSKGRRQSPVNIDPERLIYDPFLPELVIKGDALDGVLLNTGRSISVVALSGADHHYHHSHHHHHHHQHQSQGGGSGGGAQQNDRNGQVSLQHHSLLPKKPVTISGGPLSYTYTLSNVTLHFGRENNRGSEHAIAGQQFAGELQLYAFNGQLYANWSEARRSPNGLVALAVMIKLTKNAAGNSQLKHITNSLANITNRGDQQPIRSLSIRELLPADVRHYVTYEGSLTQPACFETVQWIVLNRPIYMSAGQFHLLRTSLKGDGHQDNYRPIQPLNGRLLRSNIHLSPSPGGTFHPFQGNTELKRAEGASSTDLQYNLMRSSEEEEEGEARMENVDQSFSGTGKEFPSLSPSSPFSSSSFSSFSKDLCYVNRPVAYKLNVQEMEVDF